MNALFVSCVILFLKVLFVRLILQRS